VKGNSNQVCNIVRELWSNDEDDREWKHFSLSIFSAQSARNLASDIQQGALP
jgi:hypothetical protein